MIDIRLPNITGSTEREQLVQMKSYLHQLAEQLQWALQNVDTNNNTAVIAPTARSLAPVASGSASQSDPQATFASIKSLIIKSAEIVNAYYEEIDKKLVGLYYADSDFGSFFEATEARFKATSEGITQNYNNIQTVAEEASTNLQNVKEGILGNVDYLAETINDHSTAIQDVKDGTEQSIAAVQDSVTGLSDEIDGVKSDVDERTKALDEAIKATNTVIATVIGTIKTGELYRDAMGLPVYGLEIGQVNTVNGVETFNKYARFVSNRLSFYDEQGYEVAYVSDSKLYITEAEVKGNLKIGGYLIDTSNGMAFKWVGGD